MDCLKKEIIAPLKRDAHFIQYILDEPEMLSTTEYKVLQGKEALGLIPCWRVVFNGKDKLDYDVEKWSDFQSLLISLKASEFFYCMKGIFAVVKNIQDIGFLHVEKLAFDFDTIFVDTANYSVYMIYLPLNEHHANVSFTEVLAHNVLKAIQENKNLQDAVAKEFYRLFAQDPVNLTEMRNFLECIEPPKQNKSSSAPQAEAAVEAKAEADTQALREQLVDTAQPAITSAQQQEKKTLKFSFGKKEKPNQKTEAALPTQESGNTEMLGELFVPTIVLIGTSPKEEILIRKREFVLGKQAEKSDYVISYSTAVSRQHCKISHNEKKNFVTDLGSANGTFVNGKRLESNKPYPINVGDKLKLGNVTFTVREV